MKRNKKLLIMLLILVVIVIAYLLINKWSESVEYDEYQEEISVTSYDVADIAGLKWYTDGNEYSLIKEDGQWYNANDKSMEIDQDLSEELVNEIGNITATQEITDVEDTSQYGLYEGNYLAELTFTDNTTLALISGSYNDAVGAYYLMIEGEEKVYLTDGAYLDYTDNTIDDMIAVSEDESEDEETDEEVSEE